MTIKGEEPKMMIIDDPGLDVDMQERGREILRLWYESMIKTRPPGVYFGGNFNLPPKETTMTIKGEEPKMMIIDDPGLDMQERGREILRLWYESMIKTRPPGVYFGGNFNLPPKETTMTDIFRRKYVALTPHSAEAMDQIKDAAQGLWDQIDMQGGSREVALAKTKLEECVFWATKHITDPQRQI